MSWGNPTQPNGAYTTDQFFKYEENVLEIVSKFTYLGIVFTIGGYFNTFFEILYYGVLWFNIGDTQNKALFMVN